MQNLSTSQRWVLVAMLASFAFVVTALLLQGTVQVIAFVGISTAVGAFAVVQSGSDEEKAKRG